MSKNIAVIFAGGTGIRMGNTAVPKQFLEVYEKPIIVWTLEYFEDHKEIDEIYIVCKEDWIDHLKKILDEFEVSKVVSVIPGGETAQDSIYKGLQEARKNNDGDTIVLIHDGVRPFITGSLITDHIKTVREYGSAITYTPCFETIIISENENIVGEVPPRRKTFAAQAPQSFYLDDIINAHNQIRSKNPTYEDLVDACTLYRVLDREVHMVRGNIGNIKITKPEDVYILKGLIKYRKNEEIMGVSLLDK